MEKQQTHGAVEAVNSVASMDMCRWDIFLSDREMLLLATSATQQLSNKILAHHHSKGSDENNLPLRQRNSPFD